LKRQGSSGLGYPFSGFINNKYCIPEEKPANESLVLLYYRSENGF